MATTGKRITRRKFLAVAGAALIATALTGCSPANNITMVPLPTTTIRPMNTSTPTSTATVTPIPETATPSPTPKPTETPVVPFDKEYTPEQMAAINKSKDQTERLDKWYIFWTNPHLKTESAPFYGATSITMTYLFSPDNTKAYPLLKVVKADGSTTLYTTPDNANDPPPDYNSIYIVDNTLLPNDISKGSENFDIEYTGDQVVRVDKKKSEIKYRLFDGAVWLKVVNSPKDISGKIYNQSGGEIPYGIVYNYAYKNSLRPDLANPYSWISADFLDIASVTPTEYEGVKFNVIRLKMGIPHGNSYDYFYIELPDLGDPIWSLPTDKSGRSVFIGNEGSSTFSGNLLIQNLANLVGNQVLMGIENPYSLDDLRQLEAFHLQWNLDHNYQQYMAYVKWIYDPKETNDGETNYEVYDALTHNKPLGGKVLRLGGPMFASGSSK